MPTSPPPLADPSGAPTTDADTPDPTDPGRRYAGRSRAERVGARREALLDAGLECFGTAGYRATTVRGVCRCAGLTDRYFYESFASLEDLLAAVYEREVDRLERTVGEALADADDVPLETLARRALEAYFGFAEDPRTARVVWMEVLGVAPRVDALWAGRLRQFGSLVRGLAETHPDARDVVRPLSADEAHVVAMTLVGGLSQLAVAWLLEDYRTPRATVVDGSLRVLLGAVRG